MERSISVAPTEFIGIGVYSVGDASRLTGVSTGRIRRWLRGYQFVSSDAIHRSPPVWRSQLPIVGQTLALGFLDLMEIRVVDAFLSRGVSWKTIRNASQKASAHFQTGHPFSMKGFRTDGRSIFAVIAEKERETALLDVVRSQLAFRQLLEPFLFGLEYGRDRLPARWWPLGTKRAVVIDPHRSFGQPIVDVSGVPTSVLAKAVAVEDSIDNVARWFEIDKKSVRDALDFEKKLAA